MSKVLVSLSGGMDSATVLAEAIAQGHEVATVGFCYGSKHNPYENFAARSVADFYAVPFELIDLTTAFKSFRSNLMSGQGEIPEGHYEQANMIQTVVPGRNIIFTSILAGYAWSVEAKEVWLGIHQGDHAIYDDCRSSFYHAMNAALLEGTGQRVGLAAPFLQTDKTGIVKRGLELGVPYKYTRTCYKEQAVACGKCGSCCERREAFMLNGVTDPISYESLDPLPLKPESV